MIWVYRALAVIALASIGRVVWLSVEGYLVLLSHLSREKKDSSEPTGEAEQRVSGPPEKEPMDGAADGEVQRAPSEESDGE